MGADIGSGLLPGTGDTDHRLLWSIVASFIPGALTTASPRMGAVTARSITRPPKTARSSSGVTPPGRSSRGRASVRSTMVDSTPQRRDLRLQWRQCARCGRGARAGLWWWRVCRRDWLRGGDGNTGQPYDFPGDIGLGTADGHGGKAACGFPGDAGIGRQYHGEGPGQNRSARRYATSGIW